MVARAAHKTQLVATECVLLQIEYDGVQGPPLFMSGEGHMVLQALHRQEVFVGVVLQVVVEVAHKQKVLAAVSHKEDI